MGRGYCSKCSTIAVDIDYWKHECEDTQCSQRGSLHVLRAFSNEYGLRIVVCPVLAEVSPRPLGERSGKATGLAGGLYNIIG